MRTRILITVGLLVLVLGLGWSIGQQAGSTLPSFTPGQILTADDLNTIVEQVDSNSTALSGQANAAPLQVDCDSGDSLARAVQQAQPGRTIQVSGTCAEQVTVTTDRLTLDGQGTAVLDGGGADGPIGPDFAGVLTVDGARDVTITGFTIQNGGVDGLVAAHGTALIMRNITAQDNAQSGIVITGNTVADISDITVQRNGVFGLFATGGVQVIFRGTISSTGNGLTNPTAGIGIGENSTARIHGATVQANNNQGDGIGLVDNGILISDGQVVSQVVSNTITANGNGRHGLFLGTGSFVEIGAGTTISVTDHAAGSGIFVIGNAGVVNVPSDTGEGATYLLENNTVGLNLDVQGAAFFIGGLTVRNNGTGILASGADTLTVVSIPPNPSSLTGNTTDVDLSFGTRATFDGVPIDTITCDTTVLSRGSTVCP